MILIAESGTLIGAMTSEGRALSKARGEGFAARSWLENDGDPADREIAHGRWPQEGAALRVGALVLSPGNKKGSIVCDGPRTLCGYFAPAHLRETGAVALHLRRDGQFTLRTVREGTGRRPWTPPEWRRDQDSSTRRAALQ